MTERPILFSGAMVRALLAGTKTQTRRVVKMKKHHQIEQRDDGTNWPWMYDGERDDDSWMRCPYGQPGDQLWVREAWRAVMEADHLPPRDLSPAHRVWYEADAPHQPGFGKLRPSMFMPRWASRITLEITSVRVERLQSISEADAMAEGVTALPCGDMWTAGGMYDGPLHDANPCGAYRRLWDSINGPDSWEANPWVWAVEFKPLEVCQ